ncbi:MULTISPECIES: hypothetical protein [Burkholderia cepacia complex]|uniref:hypothetical protein n=1 Tax=Burkholderia cepacia complex TaxID=87882 RepID=UPI001CF289B8|nr:MULTISPECIES: hypothetical protein [Burkholderia cepacia complex]MCA8057400.1 hypothetical protein [Burkholderia cepacia]MDN7535256.1 hypothetical protein [Burkholderia orbicola]
MAATLDVPAQSISNWFKAEQETKLGGAGTKPVSSQAALAGCRGSRDSKEISQIHRELPLWIYAYRMGFLGHSPSKFE